MRATPILLALALTGCVSSPPQLSESAKLTLNKPMPTSESERIRQCAGTTGTIRGYEVLLNLQGRPKNWGGELWALAERARRLGCTQTEMDAPDMGYWTSPSVSTRK